MRSGRPTVGQREIRAAHAHKCPNVRSGRCPTVGRPDLLCPTIPPRCFCKATAPPSRIVALGGSGGHDGSDSDCPAPTSRRRLATCKGRRTASAKLEGGEGGEGEGGGKGGGGGGEWLREGGGEVCTRTNAGLCVGGGDGVRGCAPACSRVCARVPVRARAAVISADSMMRSAPRLVDPARGSASAAPALTKKTGH